MDKIPLPQVGLMSLLSQIVRKVRVPCIAAGAINSAQTIDAVFRLGAIAAQIGTAFINTAESEAIPAYKERLAKANDTDTTLTRAFSGRWARVKLRKLAQQNNDGDYTNLWAGQSAPIDQSKATRDVFLNLVRSYEAAQY
jgi:nitronate monooxygenase